jgi:hypothetical protein
MNAPLPISLTLYTLDEWLGLPPPKKRDVYIAREYREEDLLPFLKRVFTQSLVFDLKRLGVFGEHITVLHALRALDRVSTPEQRLSICTALDDVYSREVLNIADVYHFSTDKENRALYLEHSCTIRQVMEFAACATAVEERIPSQEPSISEPWWIRVMEEWSPPDPSEQALQHYQWYREFIDSRPSNFLTHPQWNDFFHHWKTALNAAPTLALDLPDMAN